MARINPRARGAEARGRFAYPGLDRVIHERARLSVLTSLAAHAHGLAFGDLKQLCDLTDGNLSRHLQTLQEAGLVEIRKGIHDKRPQSVCRLTPIGRRRFVEYLEVLESVVSDAAASAKAEGAARKDLFKRLAPA